MKVAALIPVKDFRNAKHRLSPALREAERERLAEAMFRDVLRRVLAAAGLAATYVVTGDQRVAEIARSLGARVLRESAERGETEAVNFARSEARRAGHEAVLILPADLPLLRTEDVEALLASLPTERPAPFALLVPSHDRLGTNALLLAPPEIIELRFGYDSFNYHLEQISVRGLPPRFVENERLALDIDEPRDLERFLERGDADGETSRVVLEMLGEPRRALLGGIR
ncbi:MAG TPA: 2-phospho-L-lactate guanylyltransferase [candidate division Zixibacteria bacterium]|nr:2-phospho-L-lactate guanylyltransferase [candidate division Zixibacteria bacterium]